MPRVTFLTRYDRLANTCVDEIAECCQIRFQLKILITLIFIIVEAWKDGERHDSSWKAPTPKPSLTSLLSLLPPPSLAQNISSYLFTTPLLTQPPSEVIPSLPVLFSSPFLFSSFLLVLSILPLPAVPCFPFLLFLNAPKVGIVLSNLLPVLLSCYLSLHPLQISLWSTANYLCPRVLRLLPAGTRVLRQNAYAEACVHPKKPLVALLLHPRHRLGKHFTNWQHAH